MTKTSWSLVALLLVPPWMFLCLVCYWYFLDGFVPMTIKYNHPTFVSKPASSIEDAKLHSITTAKSGSVVWTYREFCINRDEISGVLHQRWDGAGFSWTDEEILFTSKEGCRYTSFAVEVPKIGFSSNVVYNSSREFKINPIKSYSISVPGIPLRIEVDKSKG